ncbi:MAG: hypothetical protein K0S65_1126 [Labilithrix sp.]|nr:hypothetical protein [Labilithrix sp.]
MRSNHLEIVCFALAFHLGIDPDQIEAAQRLEEDLGLDPLDLVLIVLRLEELGEVEFPVADLEGLQTVSDLVEVVAAWCGLPSEAVTLPPPPAPSESGFLPRVRPESEETSRSRRRMA